jgi:hypothetical protein
MKISHIYFFGVIYATLFGLIVSSICWPGLLTYLFWWWTLLLPGTAIYIWLPKSLFAKFLDKEICKKTKLN